MIFEALQKDRPGLLNGAVLVKADNVWDYAVRNWTKESGGVDVMDFPCIRPPFKTVFVEFFVGATWARSAGVALELVKDPVELEHLQHTLDQGAIERKGVNLEFPTEATMAISCVAFIEKTSEYTHIPWSKKTIFNEEKYLNLLPGSTVHWFIDPMGRCVPFKGSLDDGPSHYVIKLGDPEYFMKDGVFQQEQFDAMKEKTINFIYVALQTVTFMNCSNVVVRDNLPTRQQKRLAERSGLPPAHPYKTLLIYPIRKVKGEYRGGTHEPPALHLVRGHFRDYREGKGLGRWHTHGIWWWESQLRGSYNRGTVDKDYDVRVEKETQ